MSPKLTVEELAGLFEGKTRFVVRLAQSERPLTVAREVLRGLPEDELFEALNAHPRIGERTGSVLSASEQGTEADHVVLDELARLNRAYEEKFGFRFVVFVNRRSRSAILEVLRERLHRTRDEEIQTAIDELVSIAEDRYRHGQIRK